LPGAGADDDTNTTQEDHTAHKPDRRDCAGPFFVALFASLAEYQVNSVAQFKTDTPWI